MRRSRLALLFVVVAASSSAPGALAQQGGGGTVELHSFKPTPPGQYTTVTTSTRNGTAAGAPVTDTRCVSNTAPASLAGLSKMANLAAASCTMHVLRDEPAKAEMEQVCRMGPSEQRNHMLIQTVDAKTFTVDSTMTLAMGGGMTIASHSVSKLVGACTAREIREMQSAEKQPAMPRPSAEDCASIPQMRRDAEEMAASCASLPASYSNTCNERAKAARQMIDLEEQSCRKP